MGGTARRAKWGKKIEFILTCVAYSVGLGNVWRFPYLAFKNGGGAFLIPYWLTQIFVGMPLYFMELSFGQFASQGPITIWRANRLFKGVGISMVIVCAFITLYYNVIVSYCCFYLFSSMQSPLPWTHCNHYWNSPNCRAGVPGEVLNATSGNETDIFQGNTSAIVGNTSALIGNITNATSYTSPTQEYFERFALEMTGGLEDMGGLNWKLSLCLLFAWIVVFLVLIKGIQSLGKVVYFTAIFPHVLLISLLVRSAMLPGATDGMLYFLTPRWERLADATVWSDAATQVFFSLGVCMGGLNIMASFNVFKNNTLRDSILVPCVDCFTSLMCGLVVFSVLGFMAHVKGVSIEEVAAGGPGLAFIAYPEAIASMPAPTVWAILFFFMMVIIGFSSQFSMCETVIASISDEFPALLRKNFKRTVLFRFLVCAATYLLALPMTLGGGIYMLNILDSSIGGFPLLLIGIAEVVAVMFVYGYNRFTEDIAMMLGKKPSKYFKFCWCFMSPLILTGVLVFKSVMYKPLQFGEYKYPGWAQFLGWSVVVACVIAIPIWFMYYYYRHGGCKLIKAMAEPAPGWGPSLPENRTGRYADTGTPVKQADGSIPAIVITKPEVNKNEVSKLEGSKQGIENQAFTHEKDVDVTIEPLEPSGNRRRRISGNDVNSDELSRKHSITSNGSFKGSIDRRVKGRQDESIKAPVHGFVSGSIKSNTNGSDRVKSGESIKTHRKGSIINLFTGSDLVTSDLGDPGVKTEGTKILTNGSITAYNGPRSEPVANDKDTNEGRKGYALGGTMGSRAGSMKGSVAGSVKGGEGSVSGSMRSGYNGSKKRRAHQGGTRDGDNGSIKGRNPGSIRGWLNGSNVGMPEDGGLYSGDYVGTPNGSMKGSKGFGGGSIKGYPNGSMKGGFDGNVRSRAEGSVKGGLDGGPNALSGGSFKGSMNGSMKGSFKGSIKGVTNGSINSGTKGVVSGWSTGNETSTKGISVVNVTKSANPTMKTNQRGTGMVYSLDDNKPRIKTEKKDSSMIIGGFVEAKTSKTRQSEVYSLDEPATESSSRRSSMRDKVRGGVRVFPLDDPNDAVAGAAESLNGVTGSFRRNREIRGIMAAPNGSMRSVRRSDAIEEDYVASVEG